MLLSEPYAYPQMPPTYSIAPITLHLLWHFEIYISPEAYELIVKEVAQKFNFNINKVKTSYDCISVVLGIVMSFAFFGFAVFKGVGVGTIFCALINGFLIGRFSKLLEKHFDFKNKFGIQKYFE